MYDVIVVGGGIVGSSTAYHLARAGAETLLVDRADEGRATAAGAGIVSPATSSNTESDDWFAFATDAFDYFEDLVSSLETEQDGPVGFARTGLLKVAVDDDEVPVYDEGLARTRRRQETGGSPRDGSLHELSSEAARDLFPPLAETQRAFHYTDAARMDGRTFTEALQAAARGHGLDVRNASADDLVVEDSVLVGVEVGGERLDADAVVIAGGAWTPAFGERLGLSIPVEPHRGQIAHVSVDADTSQWPIVSPCRHHYLVPWNDGRVACGATREANAGFDPRTTMGGLNEVFSEALRAAPGLDSAELSEIRVGLRPASADGLPLLGTVPEIDGAFLATGHGPTGLTIGPYSGKAVADLVLGRTPPSSLDAFDPRRFRA